MTRPTAHAADRAAPSLRATRRVALALATTSAALGLLAGCASSSAKPAPTTTAPVTTVVPTTIATTTTTVPPQATVGFSSSYDAVVHLLDAWKANDKVAAAQGADAQAVEGMWATPPGELDQRGCAQTYAPELTEGGCILRRADQTGALQVNTERRAIGWVVSSAMYSPN